jgi:hypothetical protein
MFLLSLNQYYVDRLDANQHEFAAALVILQCLPLPAVTCVGDGDLRTVGRGEDSAASPAKRLRWDLYRPWG